MNNGEKYKNIPLCKKDIYGKLLNISERCFAKYIEPYNSIDITRIRYKSKTTDKLKEKLKPFDGWKIIEIK